MLNDSKNILKLCLLKINFSVELNVILYKFSISRTIRSVCHPEGI